MPDRKGKRTKTPAQIIGSTPELIAVIVQDACDALHANQGTITKVLPWLASSARVAHSWHRIVEMQLYGKSTLVAGVPLYSGYLVKHLKEHWRHCLLVKQVVCLPDDSFFEGGEQWEAEDPWPSHEPSDTTFQRILLRMMPRLPNMNSLIIDMTSSSYKIRSVTSICPSAVQCSKLVELYIINASAEMILDLLWMAPNLKSLELPNIVCNEKFRARDDVVIPPHLRLTTLYFDCESLLETLSPSQILRELMVVTCSTLEHMKARRGAAISMCMSTEGLLFPNLKTFKVLELGEQMDDYRPLRKIPEASEEVRLSFRLYGKMRWTRSHLSQLREVALRLPETCRFVFEGHPVIMPPHEKHGQANHLITFLAYIQPIFDKHGIHSSVALLDKGEEFGELDTLEEYVELLNEFEGEAEGHTASELIYSPTRTSIDPHTAWARGELSIEDLARSYSDVL